MSGVPGRAWIRRAARLVPADRREAWRREWEAEVAYAWRRLSDDHPPTLADRLRLRMRIATCTIDALWEMKETMTMTGLTNDLRHALRGLTRNPGFTAVAVLTLALGIGANTAVFTLVDGVLLRPLDFPESERLVSLRHLGRDGQDELPISQGLYLLYRDQAATLSDVAMYNTLAANFITEGEPERVLGQSVTPGFFELLGVAPAMGRTFLEEEGLPDAERPLVLSDGFWRSRFGGDADIVGRSVDVSGIMRPVVGVMPPGFGFPDATARFWLPMQFDPAEAALAGFGADGIARIAPGSTIEGVRAELGGMVAQITELFPGDGAATFLAGVGLRASVQPLKDALVGDVSTTLWILLGTVGFVLLIACANVANLLLVRAEGKQRELALRVAVGAGRLHVLRSFMGESLLLAFAGGTLGLAVAAGSLRGVTGMIPTDLPRMAEVTMDARVLGFTAAVALGAALFFGLFPLLRYGTDDLAGQLRDGGGARGATSGPGRHRLRNGLVVTQVALALVLLVGSGLMFRSFVALRGVDPGFDAEGVLTARITVPPGEIEGWQETADFFRQLRERMESQPGVRAAGLVSAVPLAGRGMTFGGLEVEDHPRAEGELPVFAAMPQADVGYFEALDIALLEGRTFRPGDDGNGARAAVVSRSFAEAWWPGESALGRGVRYGGENEEWYRIVGVVEDVRMESLEEPARDMVYFPTLIEMDGRSFPARVQDIVIRTAGDPMSLLPLLRREMRAINPRIPLASPQSMEVIVAQATARTSFTVTLLGAASAVALLLGLVGIYGVVSYVVSQRTQEIGVRMALGASAPDVRGMVVRQGLGLAGVGVVLGLLAATLLSRLLGTLLFGVSATDPITYASVSAALVVVAVFASWLPALRAAGVDPSRALRAE